MLEAFFRAWVAQFVAASIACWFGFGFLMYAASPDLTGVAFAIILIAKGATLIGGIVTALFSIMAIMLAHSARNKI